MVKRMSYAEIVDAIYGLEFGRKDQRVAKESSKKQKMRCQGVRQEAEDKRIFLQ